MNFGKEFVKEKDKMHLKIPLQTRSLSFGKTGIASPVA